MKEIINKVRNAERISPEEGLELLEKADFYQLGMLADTVRKRFHPEPVVTYVNDRNINYTDICISACKFCAFYKAPEDPDGSVLTFTELKNKIEETKQLGGTQILFQGGLHPDKPLEFYEEMLSFIKGCDIHIHGFSPPEVCPECGSHVLGVKRPKGEAPVLSCREKGCGFKKPMPSS